MRNACGLCVVICVPTASCVNTTWLCVWRGRLCDGVSTCDSVMTVEYLSVWMYPTQICDCIIMGE